MNYSLEQLIALVIVNLSIYIQSSKLKIIFHIFYNLFMHIVLINFS
jgi:hypothetical protein